jgi:16S rRNA (cytidine1402-2'-O)-methyltransferase
MSTSTALYIVPTPIGNLDDITLRAIKVLQNVDFVLCEDTRNSGILMKHLNISKPLHSHHSFNEHKSVEGIVKRLINEKVTGALISDAGTPCISDPGFLLVRECLKNGLKVECLPGATAFVPALVNSGFPSSSFVFEGFLPVKKGRKTKFEEIAQEERTVILYESPFRLLKTLQEIATYMGENREVSVSRELTKMFEETVTGTVLAVLEVFSNKPIKGEIVVVIKGKEEIKKNKYESQDL